MLKKVLKIAALVLGALFVLVTVIALLLPKSVRVQRSIVVSGSPQDVYPLVASFRTGWPQWNPFQNEAPMQMTYAGPEQGVGAVQKWESEQMGDGRMEITQADPSRGVAYDLHLMHDSYRLSGSLICEPAQGGTRVTWTDDMGYGSNPYRRYMGLLIEKPLGDSFEKGLSALKTKVEARAVAAPSTSL